MSEPSPRRWQTASATRSNADVGVGITGIAGPGGGSPEKPVGTVALAVATTAERRASRLFRFHGEREQVKFQASQAGLDMVRRMLLGVPRPREPASWTLVDTVVGIRTGGSR